MYVYCPDTNPNNPNDPNNLDSEKQMNRNRFQNSPAELERYRDIYSKHVETLVNASQDCGEDCGERGRDKRMLTFTTFSHIYEALELAAGNCFVRGGIVHLLIERCLDAFRPRPGPPQDDAKDGEDEAEDEDEDLGEGGDNEDEDEHEDEDEDEDEDLGEGGDNEDEDEDEDEAFDERDMVYHVLQAFSIPNGRDNEEGQGPNVDEDDKKNRKEMKQRKAAVERLRVGFLKLCGVADLAEQDIGEGRGGGSGEDVGNEVGGGSAVRLGV